jgi:hypothetical protein
LKGRDQLSLQGAPSSRPARQPSRWPGGAIFAPTDDATTAAYRLWLWRERPGGDRRNRVAFIGINPSTADAEFDDATIRKEIGFATRWGFDCLDMVNLWPFCSRDPDALLVADAPEFESFKLDVPSAPVVSDGDRMLREVFRRARRVVAAWGSHEMVKRHPERVRAVLALVPAGVDLVALRVSEKGHPLHPLYQPYDAQLVAFRGAR